MKFLKTEFAEELLDCYRAIHAYKESFKKDKPSPEAAQEVRVAEAKRINDTYCKPGAEFQVNLSGKLIRKLKKDIADDANVTVSLYNKISEDLARPPAREISARYVS